MFIPPFQRVLTLNEEEEDTEGRKVANIVQVKVSKR
jgi:hypothetical protein